MEREELPDGFRLRDRSGVLTLTRPRPSIDLIHGEGHASVPFVDAIIAQRDAVVASCGSISIFDDLELVRGYDSGVRARLTAWSRANRAVIKEFHILTGSRIVAMGVTVANIALGGQIVVHLRRVDFERALKRAIDLA
jgi:hypothetical protein